MRLFRNARVRLAAVGVIASVGLSGCATTDPYLMNDVLRIVETTAYVVAEDARRDAYRSYARHNNRGHYQRPHHPRHDRRGPHRPHRRH